MQQHLAKSLKTFFKNVVIHAKRVVLRQESVRSAASGMSKDSGRLARAVKGSRKPGDHHRAARLVEKGRKAYNSKKYDLAENYLRKAVLEDPNYALAHCHLGSTMYKLERLREAVYHWTRAAELEPGSDAAARAERSLRHIQMQKKDVIAALEERLD